MNKKILFWSLTFSTLLILTLATRFFHFSNGPFLFGWPFWLFYLIGLHLLIVFALIHFSRRYLKEQE